MIPSHEGTDLFLAVWIPCCTSDIVFPLLFVENRVRLRTAQSDRH